MEALTKELLCCGSKCFSLSTFLESSFAVVYRKIAFLLQVGVQFSTSNFQVPSVYKVPFGISSNVVDTDTIGASILIFKRLSDQPRKSVGLFAFCGKCKRVLFPIVTHK